MPQKVTVKQDYHNSRFDRWFKANIINLPQSLIEKILRLNKIKINRKKIKSSHRVQSGDIIEIYDTNKMIFVKGGKFNFGSDNGLEREKPEREVIIQSFLIDKNLVTVVLFFFVATIP